MSMLECACEWSTPFFLTTSPTFVSSVLGSLFELVGGSELQFGFAVTAAIAAIGTPIAMFLFYAAIAKATAETEEDDKAFLSGK